MAGLDDLFNQIPMADIAKKLGLSKEWTTAACLGQMTLTKKQADIVGRMLDLPKDAVQLLQVVPYKGSLPSAVPTDPLIYRWYDKKNHRSSCWYQALFLI